MMNGNFQVNDLVKNCMTRDKGRIFRVRKLYQMHGVWVADLSRVRQDGTDAVNRGLLYRTEILSGLTKLELKWTGR
jgi:hypothetical protein